MKSIGCYLRNLVYFLIKKKKRTILAYQIVIADVELINVMKNFNLCYFIFKIDPFSKCFIYSLFVSKEKQIKIYLIEILNKKKIY